MSVTITGKTVTVLKQTLVQKRTFAEILSNLFVSVIFFNAWRTDVNKCCPCLEAHIFQSLRETFMLNFYTQTEIRIDQIEM